MADPRSSMDSNAFCPRHENVLSKRQDFLSDGETGALIRSMDWSATPLGSRDAWPESLRTVAELILASSFPMAILWGSDLTFIYNDAYRIIAADKHPNAMGRSTREVWPEVWEFNKPVFERVMARGKTVHFEDQLFRILRHGYMEDVTGGVIGWQDITERKQMEQSLLEREERVQSQLVEIETIYHSAPVGMCVFDRDLRYLRINNRLAEINGIPAENHIGKTIEDIVPDLADLARNLSERIFRTGEPELNVEFSGNTQNLPDVERHWVEQWLPLKDPSGEIIGINVVAEEITDRKRSEESLRKSEERFRTAVETMPDSFAIFSAVRDDTGRIVDFQYQYINELGARMNCLPAADHIGRTILELLPAHRGTLLFSDYIRITEEGGSLAEESLIYEDIYAGERLARAFDIKATKLGDGFAVIWRDVTERKRAEESLMRYRDELEQRVRERTSELERKNRELQEFAFVASHDLSEPLRKIQTFGDLLKAKGSNHLSDMEKDYISRMTGAANRMQELLDALLRYSRIESKGQEFRPVKLDEIIREAASDLEVTIRKTGAYLEIGSLRTLQGDPFQLRQLFQNLISNSLKYYRSEVKLLVRIYGEENNGACRIFVEDNGIGFDEKYLQKIFEPFQRLHGRNEYPGSGIGLAICKKIVERHGGTITARSTPGKGSTFIIILPVRKVVK